MRLLDTSKSFFKGAAACASMFTFCMTPVAQGAAAKNTQKQLIAQYLKETGLSQKNNKMTANEFYNIVRVVYPDVLKSQLDPWFAENKNESLPVVEASSFVDANNIEQVRLTLSKDGETMTVTFTGDDEFPLKVNGVALSRSEILNPANFSAMSAKLIAKDKAISKSVNKGKYLAPVTAGSSKEDQRKLMKASLNAFPAKKLFVNSKSYTKMSSKERIEYFMRIRAMMDSAELVHDAFRNAKKTASVDTDKYQVVMNLILGENAQAAVSSGGKCIIAGFVSTYGSNLSCGTDSTTDATTQYSKIMSKSTGFKSCQTTEVPCNPLVYGFNNSGQPYCIPTTSKAAINSATKLCNGLSPLSGPDISAEQEAQNKKRIVESFLKAAKGKDAKVNPVNKDGEYKIPPTEYEQISDYINGLKGYITEANSMCQSEDGRSTTTSRPDQLEACEELAKRAFDLKTYADEVQSQLPPVVVDPDNGLPNCDEKIKNSVLVGAVEGDGKSQTQKPDKKGKGKGSKAAAGAQAATPGGGYKCECPSGTTLNKEGTECVGGGAVTDEVKCPNNKPPKNGKCEKNRSWLIPLGIGVLALGALWWITSSKKKKNNNNTYVPPVGPTDPTTPTNPVDPVTPVEPSPCPAPNVYINGKCTSVVVYGGEGGTTVDDVNRGGGVRSATGVR